MSFSVFQDLPSELKKKNDSKKVCTSSLSSEFPEDCKFYPADTKDDLHKVMIWRFCFMMSSDISLSQCINL